MLGKNTKIFLSGHNGLVGSAILRKLKHYRFKNIITVDRSDLDLTNQQKVFNFLKKKKPNAVIIASARVGGILDNNKYRGEYIYENLSIQNNLIHGSFLNNVKNLIFLGSSCVYPKKCNQPIKEKYLLTSELEYTNEPYAIAKIAGIKLCESYNLQYKTQYKCLMPSNTYGPNDNYNPDSSHFFPALINKIYEAQKKNKKQIILWGSGKARRELIFVDDLADACIFFLNKNTKEHIINIGTGKDKTVKQYAEFILDQLGLKIKINFDTKKPDGTPRKLLDISLAKKYGWSPKIELSKGFKITYKDYLKNKKLGKAKECI
jgi:GDP-L-fucose synthase